MGQLCTVKGLRVPCTCLQVSKDAGINYLAEQRCGGKDKGVRETSHSNHKGSNASLATREEVRYTSHCFSVVQVEIVDFIVFCQCQEPHLCCFWTLQSHGHFHPWSDLHLQAKGVQAQDLDAFDAGDSVGVEEEVCDLEIVCSHDKAGVFPSRQEFDAALQGAQEASLPAGYDGAEDFSGEEVKPDVATLLRKFTERVRFCLPFHQRLYSFYPVCKCFQVMACTTRPQGWIRIFLNWLKTIFHFFTQSELV